MRTVGILGGMGPEATILLMQKVLDAVPARDDADHVPLIVHQNPQVPSRIAALLEGGDVDPGPTLAAMARALAAGGAQALAMPCNTAHHYSDTVRAAVDIPFLDMIDLTARQLGASGARRVGLLASPAVRLTDAFGPALSRAGLLPVFPSDDAAILSIIRDVKSGGRGDADLFVAQAQALIGAGCDHVLVACTELSLMTGAIPPEITVTDSLDCLVAEIIRFASAPD